MPAIPAAMLEYVDLFSSRKVAPNPLRIARSTKTADTRLGEPISGLPKTS
jgi:hypothetical protein